MDVDAWADPGVVARGGCVVDGRDRGTAGVAEQIADPGISTLRGPLETCGDNRGSRGASYEARR
jgi:hypothetical protein